MDRWLAAIREHKGGLVALLAATFALARASLPSLGDAIAKCLVVERRQRTASGDSFQIHRPKVAVIFSLTVGNSARASGCNMRSDSCRSQVDTLFCFLISS